jgi:2-polyprenyl-3-methyl-5-hydroxy-6-metoxy-1,4-benzoquinol methylase
LERRNYLKHNNIDELEISNCNLCGSVSYEFLFKANENQFYLRDNFNIVKCVVCGLVFTNPRPIKDNIHKYYSKGKYYTHQSIDDTINDNKKRWIIKTLIYNKLYRVNKLNKKNIIIKLLETILHFLFNKFISVIIPYKNNGNILDVGCGNGTFLNFIKKYGWNTYGTEISDYSIIKCKEKDINVFKGELHEAEHQNKYFDVVVVNQVLEHLYDPLNFLIECKRILKDDGLLIIGVPNFNSYDSRILQGDWQALQVPTHLYHFSTKTLTRMLEKAGFQVAFRKQPFLAQYDYLYYKINLRNIKYSISLDYRIKINNIILIKNIIAKLFCLFIIKPILYLFSNDKNEKYSLNISAYATKMKI